MIETKEIRKRVEDLQSLQPVVIVSICSSVLVSKASDIASALDKPRDDVYDIVDALTNLLGGDDESEDEGED